MGLYTQSTCFITGRTTTPHMNGKDAVEYYVKIGESTFFMSFHPDVFQWIETDQFIIENKNLLYSLLCNNKWIENQNVLIKVETLKELVAKADYPRTPTQKLESLFLKLFEFQKEDGELINIHEGDYDNMLWRKLYFKSLNELNYYVQYLEQTGLIDADFGQTKDRPNLLVKYRITFSGLNEAIRMQEEGDHSDKCFIAMSFKPETLEIREAIKASLIKTGFIPIIIDEQNINSDQTINDEIIANLKRCKFCISDFTFHSNGVYFESGYASGQGKKVIYTCRKDEFENAHFDIRPLQHIIYDSPEQLEIDLINKIEAWIK